MILRGVEDGGIGEETASSQPKELWKEELQLWWVRAGTLTQTRSGAARSRPRPAQGRAPTGQGPHRADNPTSPAAGLELSAFPWQNCDSSLQQQPTNLSNQPLTNTLNNQTLGIFGKQYRKQYRRILRTQGRCLLRCIPGPMRNSSRGTMQLSRLLTANCTCCLAMHSRQRPGWPWSRAWPHFARPA